MKFRIYIDEVGNPDISSSEDHNHRFLSLTGVIIDLDHAENVVHPQMEDLKKRYFHSHPDDPVILHRKEILNAKPPFESLKNEKIRDSFDLELLALMAAWNYILITVCLDKKAHKETYQTWRYDPYHYCLAVLLERFVFFLNRHSCRGDVMAESRGGKEDNRLKASFHRLWESGTEYVEPTQFQSALTSGQLKIKPKRVNVAGLQLADLLAFPSRAEMLHEKNLFGRDLPKFTRKLLKVLYAKYDQQGDKVFGRKYI
jgi:hypothetical protein